MSQQTKGTTTNLRKLVSWDIDQYESMSDEENCLLFLSERDKYLLKSALRQAKWRTRWTSEVGTAQPNREAIAENMAFKLSQEYCVDICQLIIDCIDDPESGVAQAIINTVGNTSSTELIDVGQGQENLLLGDGNNPSCDFDVWYGGVNNLVLSLHENNEDALQILEVATNVAEWLAQVGAGIFGVEAPIAQSMADWGLFIQQSILENYEAQFTQQYRETITCDLFCLATENCELTPQMIVDYFYDRLASQLTFGSLLTESLEFLVLGVWTGTEIADAMMLSQLVFRAQFGRWFGDIAFNSIDLDLRLGFNDPSDDWTLLCPDCGWSETWLNGNGDPVVDGWVAVLGTYNAGQERYEGEDNGGTSDVIQLIYTVPATLEATITQINYHYNYETQEQRTLKIRIKDDLGATIQEELLVINGTGSGTLTLSDSQAVEEDWVLFVALPVENRYTPFHVYLNALTVDGTGDNIFT